MASRGVQFEIPALAGFAGDLNTLRDDIRANLSTASDRGARSVQRGARQRVPKDRGDLANAIDVGGKGIARTVGLSDRAVASRGGSNSAHLNPWVYGVWIEFGLKHRNMEAQPYMGPAADAEEPAIQRDFEQALNGALA